MKNQLFATALLVCSSFLSFAQTETVVPENTQVNLKFNQDVKEGKVKAGTAIQIVVADDVKVNDVLVIAKNTPVRATLTNDKKRELRVDIYDTKAVDGTTVNLRDCWVFTTAAQNYTSRGALIVTGTKKNCFVEKDVAVKGK